MQMIDVLKRLAKLDAKNPNVVSEISQGLAAKAYNKMAVGDDPWKNRTGLAGDQSDRMKARMDKRWGPTATDAAIEKDKLIPGKFYVVTQDHRYAPIKPVAADDWSDDSYEAQIKKAEYDEGGKHEAAVAQWTGKDWNFDFSEGVAEGLEECGMMPGIGMTTMPERPSTPATINMTAGSADELGNLLKDIVSLAGLNKSEPEMPVPLGAPSVLEPADDDMGPPEPGSAVDSMRSVIDKLNPMDGDDDQGEEEPEDDNKEKVDELDNEPSDPTKPPPFNANQYANNENQPGQGDRMDGNMPKGNPEMNFESLMAEYKKFIREDETN